MYLHPANELVLNGLIPELGDPPQTCKRVRPGTPLEVRRSVPHHASVTDVSEAVSDDGPTLPPPSPGGCADEHTYEVTVRQLMMATGHSQLSGAPSIPKLAGIAGWP